jgi:hypothetical protein
MKRTGTAGSDKGTKNLLSKSAFHIAKSATGNNFSTSAQDKPNEDEEPVRTSADQLRREEEELLMGTNNIDTSHAQMINPLKSRLARCLELGAEINQFEEDRSLVMLDGKVFHDKTRRIVSGTKSSITEFDDTIHKTLRDVKGSGVHKDNLVSAEGVFVDPIRLVLKTKVPTEKAKLLEMTLEESFGTVNIRELKSKKSKNAVSQSEKSKKSEQLKNEAKRRSRAKLEKILQNNMESFLTRSITDLPFKPPEDLDEECVWPISVQWCKQDPRSRISPYNAEGEFKPQLLLRYALERMNLPSGRKLFLFLIQQDMIQSYFVSLFWLIKIKFFETDTAPEAEAYLLRKLGEDYRRLIELMAGRARAEHEKDFVFKYLAFLLCSGVYWGFFYICPGSRHMYTKGLKKTIFMQIIQIIYGVQLCSASVRVSWAKMFPEDVQDETDDPSETAGGDTFPMQLALNGPKFDTENNATLRNSKVLSLDLERSQSAPSDPSGSFASPMNGLVPMSSPQVRGVTKGAFLVPSDGEGPGDSAAAYDAPSLSSLQQPWLSEDVQSAVVVGATFSSMLPLPDRSHHHGHDVASAVNRGLHAKVPLHHGTMVGGLGISAAKNNFDPSIEKLAYIDHHLRDMDKTTPAHNLAPLTRQSTSASLATLKPLTRQATEITIGWDDADHLSNPEGANVTSKQFFENQATKASLQRTFLKPLITKPTTVQTLKRQCNYEMVNAQGLSPQVQLFLSGIKDKPDSLGPYEPFHRTLPVSWCPAGGTETHKKKKLPTELVAEVAVKLRQNSTDFKSYSIQYHKEKVKGLLENEKQVTKVRMDYVSVYNISTYTGNIFYVSAMHALGVVLRLL